MAKRQLDRHETEGRRQQCKNPTENQANYFAEVYLSLMTKKNVEKMLVTVGLKQDLIQQNKAVE
jgi:hypothetical protein